MHRFLNMILDSIFLLMTSGAKDTWWCRSLFKQEGRWLIHETACVLLNLNLQVLHFAQTPLSRWENQSNLQIYTRKTTNVSKNLRKRIWKEFFYVILTNFFMRVGFVTARARRFCCNYYVEFNDLTYIPHSPPSDPQFHWWRDNSRRNVWMFLRSQFRDKISRFWDYFTIFLAVVSLF